MVVSSPVSLQLYLVFADPLGSDHGFVLDVALAKIIGGLGWSVLLNLLMIYSSGNAYTGRRSTAAHSPFPGDVCRERDRKSDHSHAHEASCFAKHGMDRSPHTHYGELWYTEERTGQVIIAWSLS